MKAEIDCGDDVVLSLDGCSYSDTFVESWKREMHLLSMCYDHSVTTVVSDILNISDASQSPEITSCSLRLVASTAQDPTK